MLTIKLKKIDELMLLTDEIKCLSFLSSLLNDCCCDELEDSRSIASAANLYLMKLNEKTTDQLCDLVFDENFVKPFKK